MHCMCHRFLNLICIDGIAAMCKNTEPGIHLPARTLAAGMIGGFHRYIRSIPRKTRICKKQDENTGGAILRFIGSGGNPEESILGIFIMVNRKGKGKCYFGGQIPSNNSAQSGGFI